MKMLQAKLESLMAMVNKTYAPPPTALPERPTTTAVPLSSCKEQYQKYNSTKSQVFTLMFGSQKIPVYCHMGNFGCGDGGWTLAMKINGTKKTFHYNSQFWKDRNAYNLVGGLTGFDSEETKLPTYWKTPFSKICLGMKVGQQLNFIVINKQANSLYSLIANGKYRATSLGRNTWKRLIGSQASLQPNCNKEGFNAVSTGIYSKARIGILGNEQNDCNTCDSRIGFGTGGQYDDSNTCGNEATVRTDNGDKHIKAMGYILVQ
ncbi:putative skeletal organic matrix protein 5 [Oculina patagonica]